MSIARQMDRPVRDEAAYEHDFGRWAEVQAKRLRDRSAGDLDWDNLAEEIASMGISQERELLSRLTVIIEHLLKIEYGLRSEPRAGWRRTVNTQRIELARLLERNPGLRSGLAEAVAKVYPDALSQAFDAFDEYEPESTGIYEARLPFRLAYDAEQVISRDFMPEPPDSETA